MSDNLCFTSDHHFGHENIIRFCERPFASVEEMDAELIERWNSRVKGGDTVYHLGDFTLGDWNQARRYFKQLSGKIRVLGNTWHHDKRWMKHHIECKPIVSRSGFPVEIVPPIVVLEFPELGDGRYPQALTLCHYPIAEWDRKHHSGWHLHGHSHGSYLWPGGLVFDIGVDCNQFYPIRLSGIVRQMRAYGWKRAARG